MFRINELGQVERKDAPLGATAGPSPWWMTRGPRNAQEALEFSALKHVADERMEMARVIRDRHPAIFAEAHSDIAPTLTEYELHRAAAAQLGQVAPEPDAQLIRRVDSLVKDLELSTGGEGAEARVAGETNAFLAAVAADDLNAALAAFRRWVVEHERGQQERRHVTSVRNALLMTSHGEWRHEPPPAFLEELNKALPGATAFQYGRVS